VTRLRRYRWAIGLVAAAVLIALVSGRPPSSPKSLDPNSTQPDGTKALVLLLRALGDHVTTGATTPTSTPAGNGYALLLHDHLNNTDRNSLIDWVDRGNTLVLTDPASPLAQVTADTSPNDQLFFGPAQPQLASACVAEAQPLDAVADIQPEGGQLFRPTSEQLGCFPFGNGYYMVARTQGSGTVVVAGGPGMWINANLGRADNSVLAAALLAPSPGSSVTFIGSSRIGGGSTGLFGLIAPRLKELFWELVIAFLLIVLWRARRLGRPISEPLPVELPGSELVVAAGSLLHEGGHRARAVELLRRDLRTVISRQLGFERGINDETLAQLTADRTGISEAFLLDALAGPLPSSDGDLVRVCQAIETIRREVTHPQEMTIGT
jgi:Domain of unknown function (DUF4350)